jgi:hypothetical protein
MAEQTTESGIDLARVIYTALNSNPADVEAITGKPFVEMLSFRMCQALADIICDEFIVTKRRAAIQESATAAVPLVPGRLQGA